MLDLHLVDARFVTQHVLRALRIALGQRQHALVNGELHQPRHLEQLAILQVSSKFFYESDATFRLRGY